MTSYFSFRCISCAEFREVTRSVQALRQLPHSLGGELTYNPARCFHLAVGDAKSVQNQVSFRTERLADALKHTG
jgi:hypothetical protein